MDDPKLRIKLLLYHKRKLQDPKAKVNPFYKKNTGSITVAQSF